MDKDSIEELIEKKVEEKLQERQDSDKPSESKLENLIEEKVNNAGNNEETVNSQETDGNISRRNFMKTLGLGATGLALTSAVGAQWYSFGGGADGGSGGSTSFSGSHNDLSNVESGDHHSKTSSASELSDVSPDSISDAHHSKTSSASEISNVSPDSISDAHHTRYSDSEARSAVESGNLSQIDGANNFRIRFDSDPSWIELTDQSNTRTDLVTNDMFADGRWFSDHRTDNAAHHTKYTDNAARNAVDGANIDINGDADTVDGQHASEIGGTGEVYANTPETISTQTKNVDSDGGSVSYSDSTTEPVTAAVAVIRCDSTGTYDPDDRADVELNFNGGSHSALIDNVGGGSTTLSVNNGNAVPIGTTITASASIINDRSGSHTYEITFTLKEQNKVPNHTHY